MRTHQGSWSFSLAAALALLCPFDLIASLGMDMYLPAVPQLPGRLGTSPENVQFTLSGYLVVLGAGQLVFGPLSDRIGRRPVLLAGGLGFAVSSLSLVACRSFPLFLALRVVEAASAAAMLVATFATVRDVYASRKEGPRIYGIMSGILVFVPAFGPFVGATLYELGGLEAILGTLGALAAAASWRAYRRWPETRPDGRRHVRWHHAASVLRSRRFWTYTLGHGVAMGAFFVYLSIAPAMLMHHWHYSPLVFSLLFGTVALVLIGTARKAERLVAGHGAGKTFAGGLGLIALGATLTLTVHVVDHVGAFIGPMWIVAAGIAMVVAVAAHRALAPFGEVAGTATVLFQCAGTVFFVSAGTLAVVTLSDARALAAFALGGVALVAAISRRLP